MPTVESRQIEIACVACREKERSIELFDGTRKEWFPTSQVTDNEDGTYSMPEWLAKDRGFI
jgi:hypothetical protein